MTGKVAFTGARIFDGAIWHEDCALLAEGALVAGIVPAAAIPPDAALCRLPGGLLVPGFVDLQVNGGGGVMLNDARSREGIATICAAHAPFGTTALLPTLITDTPAITAEAVAAGVAATGTVPGFLGLHLEGPHLSVARKGAHDPSLIRPMSEADIEALLAAQRALPNLLVTLAAETVPPAAIARLRAGGVVVSIGHSDAGYETVIAAADAGASMATHLFNAMSQIGNRDPGLAGAVVDRGDLWAGLIADGIHVHPATIGAALRAKRGPGRIFLVTDAMALTGTARTEFTLNGRTIRRQNGALRLPDGTLAGADLTMIDAVTFVHRTLEVTLDEALRMASLYPAQALGVADQVGCLRPGARADFVVLDAGLAVRSTWIGGEATFGA